MELSHDVKFNEALYPGISLFNPAGLLTPPNKIEEIFEEDSPLESGKSPDIPPQEDGSESSGDSIREIEQQLTAAPLPPVPVLDDKEEPSIPGGLSSS
ncbi:hypothetical protein PCANC_16911 [Puccinia coronata f. sp. avenae]|uniref:Uncharacterized protein n=1 Tax=Puccinia coronata f. sp. avenae TaxID=200324 RepID=A0A2N5SNQ6_9BASI|nr:hypothetical protein PCANC_16911 [Puccinia coronata f. sp. avenae]